MTHDPEPPKPKYKSDSTLFTGWVWKVHNPQRGYERVVNRSFSHGPAWPPELENRPLAQERFISGQIEMRSPPLKQKWSQCVRAGAISLAQREQVQGAATEAALLLIPGPSLFPALALEHAHRAATEGI
jgi:hypothetical protein